jgi:hypothetical protein
MNHLVVALFASKYVVVEALNADHDTLRASNLYAAGRSRRPC